MRAEYGHVRPWELEQFTLNELNDVLDMMNNDAEAIDKNKRETAKQQRRGKKGRR